MSWPRELFFDMGHTGAIADNMRELSDHFSTIAFDQNGTSLVQHERQIAERGVVDGLHSTIHQDFVHRVKRCRVLEHRIGEPEQSNPGAAVEIIAAATDVDGTLEVGMTGDDEVDR